MTVLDRADWLAALDLALPAGEGTVSPADLRSALVSLSASVDWTRDRVRNFRFGGQYRLGNNQVIGWGVRSWMDDTHTQVLSNSATSGSITRTSGGPRWTTDIELLELRLSYRQNLVGGGIGWAPAVYAIEKDWNADPFMNVDTVIAHPGRTGGSGWIVPGDDVAQEILLDLEGFILPAGDSLCFAAACPDNTLSGSSIYSQVLEGTFRYREVPAS